MGRDFDAADALALRGVNAPCRDFHVLHDVSFSVKHGCVLELNTGQIVYDGPAGDARNLPDLLHVHLGVY